MKIFYGVQGTGNGHIARSRAMAEEFKKHNVDVQFMFSGRPNGDFFDMEVFGDYITKTGLTFNTDNGKINILKTLYQTEYLEFIKDVKSLDLTQYDKVICDYEPITAWSAKLSNVDTIGVGHQYAFNYNIPKDGNNILLDNVMKWFAPVAEPIGLHWDHFNNIGILPPIIEPFDMSNIIVVPNKVLVYLPFENTKKVIDLFKSFTNYTFHIYTPKPLFSGHSHIVCNNLSKDGFRQDLKECSMVISNAGFELISEALSINKKILVKPIQGQMEQESNAKALKFLNYAWVMKDLSKDMVESFLFKPNLDIDFNIPNVAEYIVRHILYGENKPFYEIWK